VVEALPHTSLTKLLLLGAVFFGGIVAAIGLGFWASNSTRQPADGLPNYSLECGSGTESQEANDCFIQLAPGIRFYHDPKVYKYNAARSDESFYTFAVGQFQTSIVSVLGHLPDGVSQTDFVSAIIEEESNNGEGQPFKLVSLKETVVGDFDASEVKFETVRGGLDITDITTVINADGLAIFVSTVVLLQASRILEIDERHVKSLNSLDFTPDNTQSKLD